MEVEGETETCLISFLPEGEALLREDIRGRTGNIECAKMRQTFSKNLLKVMLARPLRIFQAMHPGVGVGGRAFSLSIFLFILQPMEAPQGEYLKFIGILISCAVAVIDLFLWKP